MALLAANQGIDLWIALIVRCWPPPGIGQRTDDDFGRIPAFIVTLGMLYIVRGARW